MSLYWAWFLSAFKGNSRSPQLQQRGVKAKVPHTTGMSISSPAGVKSRLVLGTILNLPQVFHLCHQGAKSFEWDWVTLGPKTQTMENRASSQLSVDKQCEQEKKSCYFNTVILK